MLRANFWISYLIVAFTTVCWSPKIFASKSESLNSGIEHYKSGNYSLALIEWHTLLQNKKYANSPEVLFNLALTEFKLGDYGASTAHLRRALTINPLSLKTHKTLKLVTKAIEDRDFHRIKHDPFLHIVISWLPKTIFVVCFFIIIGLGTIIGLRQKTASIGFWPYFKIYLYYLAGSTIPLIFLFWQIWVQDQTFATVTGKKSVTIYTNQDFKAPELGSLRIGDSFKIIGLSKKEINKTKQDKINWIAISTEELPLGWINTSDYIVHRGKIDQ